MLRDLPSPSRPLQTWASWARDFSNPSRPVFEASLPTASCRLLTLKPKKSDDNIARDRAGSAANYHVTFWLSPAWGDHKKLIHVDQNSFKCGPVWAACPRLRPPAGCPWLARREKLVEVKQMDIHGAGRGAPSLQRRLVRRRLPCGSQEPRAPGRVCDPVCGGSRRGPCLLQPLLPGLQGEPAPGHTWSCPCACYRMILP